MRQWWLRRSLRLRLAVWYAVTSTLILLALGGMLLFVVGGRLLSELDRQLRDDFEMVESRVTRDPEGNFRWLGYGHKEEEQVDPWFEILSPAGSILLSEGPPSGLKMTSSLVHREGTVAPFSTELQRHLHVRVLENSTRIADAPVVLRVIRPEAELRRAMAELGAVLAFGLPLAGVLSATGGSFIAHRSLSPISQIAARARQITADSLGGRLPVPNPHDELGRLAIVFNATLARLENSFAELRRFTADASHELRTPLTALRAVGEAALRSDAEQLIIPADRELFRLALLNLGHNAIRYSAEGLLIRLRVRQQEENAVVEVIDQGPGIAPQHQQKIFERFYRVDKGPIAY